MWFLNIIPFAFSKSLNLFRRQVSEGQNPGLVVLLLLFVFLNSPMSMSTVSRQFMRSYTFHIYFLKVVE